MSNNEPWSMREAKKYFRKKYDKDMTPSYLKNAPAKQVSDYTGMKKRMKKLQKEKVDLGTKRYSRMGKKDNFKIDINEKLLRRRAKKQYKESKVKKVGNQTVKVGKENASKWVNYFTDKFKNRK